MIKELIKNEVNKKYQRNEERALPAAIFTKSEISAVSGSGGVVLERVDENAQCLLVVACLAIENGQYRILGCEVKMR